MLFILLIANLFIEIPGRQEEPLYRVQLHDWEQKPLDSNYQTDSTLANATFIKEGLELTIHNFPDIKIPPKAQVTRWQRQFDLLVESKVTEVAWGGFEGLLFEGKGLIKDRETQVMALAMQIGSQFRAKGEMKADITIKVIGEIGPLRDSVWQAMQTFELIEEIPT